MASTGCHKGTGAPKGVLRQERRHEKTPAPRGTGVFQIWKGPDQLSLSTTA